jgi:hypothetical protein
MVQFRFKLAAVLLLWKNNIVDFTINVQEISDPEHIVKRSRSNNDSDGEVSQNYATLIGVISLTCSDSLFDGIYNYLQMVNDDEFVK